MSDRRSRYDRDVKVLLNGRHGVPEMCIAETGRRLGRSIAARGAGPLAPKWGRVPCAIGAAGRRVRDLLAAPTLARTLPQTPSHKYRLAIWDLSTLVGHR